MWALHMCCCCSISAAANGVVQIALEAQVFHVFHMQKKKKSWLLELQMLAE